MADDLKNKQHSHYPTSTLKIVKNENNELITLPKYIVDDLSTVVNEKLQESYVTFQILAVPNKTGWWWVRVSAESSLNGRAFWKPIFVSLVDNGNGEFVPYFDSASDDFQNFVQKFDGWVGPIVAPSGKEDYFD